MSEEMIQSVETTVTTTDPVQNETADTKVETTTTTPTETITESDNTVDDTPTYYTQDEFKDEIIEKGIEGVDPNRLPDELKPFYKSMLSDYRRKTEAIAKQAREPQQPPPQQQPQVSPEQALNNVVNDAVVMTRQALGMGPDDLLDLGDPRQFTAYNLALQRIVTNVHAEQQRQTAFNNYVADMADADPEVNAVIDYVKQEWNNLPTRITDAIKKAANDPTHVNLKKLDRIVTEVKKLQYERQKPKQKITKEPPVTVTPKPIETPARPKVEELDPSILGSSDLETRIAMLGKVRRGEAVWKSKG